MANTSRHNKNKPTEMKMTVKVSLYEWRKVNKMAENKGVEASTFVRGLISEATKDCQLNLADMEIIADRLQKNLGNYLKKESKNA